MPTPVTWRKSSFSGGSDSACVEVASTLDRIRDSKAPDQVLQVPVHALVRRARSNAMNGPFIPVSAMNGPFIALSGGGR